MKVSALFRISVLLAVLCVMGLLGLKGSLDSSGVHIVRAASLDIVLRSGDSNFLVFQASVSEGCPSQLAPGDSCYASVLVVNQGGENAEISPPSAFVSGPMHTCSGEDPASPGSDGQNIIVSFQNVTYSGAVTLLAPGDSASFDVVFVIDLAMPNACQAKTGTIDVSIQTGLAAIAATPTATPELPSATPDLPSATPEPPMATPQSAGVEATFAALPITTAQNTAVPISTAQVATTPNTGATAPADAATAAAATGVQAQTTGGAALTDGDETSAQEATPPPDVTSTPSITPTPTRDPGTSAMVQPTAQAGPTQPAGEVAGVVFVPKTFLNKVPGFASITWDLEVVGTNLLLALIALLIILVATNVFNETLEANGPEINLLVAKLTGPAAGVAAFMGWRAETTDDPVAHRSFLLTLLKPALLILLIASIYALMEPGVGVNDETLMLVASMFTGIAMATFLYEGGQVWWSSHRYQTPAAMRLFPLAIIIAIGSVLLVRLTDLHPGVIFGFVTAAMIFQEGDMPARQRGMIITVPLIALLILSAGAFMLIDPLREFSANNPGTWGALPETVAVTVFVGGAESALLILLPFKFNDGANVWDWSKAVWFLLAVPATFMFFHVIVNDEELGALVSEGGTSTLIIIAGVVLAIASVTWLYFHRREKHGA